MAETITEDIIRVLLFNLHKRGHRNRNSDDLLFRYQLLRRRRRRLETGFSPQIYKIFRENIFAWIAFKYLLCIAVPPVYLYVQAAGRTKIKQG